ncbi:SDR family oxidoreductase [Paraburkholderia atlantica]|uniref:NAD(P)-dependent dehydrogenase (Short-subunit alcohol dehydrogenase family) n=1 Tax=Paraburkholderia atlantica TaxID=2654982 RepID=A0A7W8Q682_PARAM|nr:SDR family oxidoreductase [Paraburkholderia atlantica]MBB5424459.1 NAD(P)-dependent dehydrogenase (short-subunit alcohol dehydrogenase family) [Paraburkholderia atlantica]NUY31093.1 SDR family oxidoreductase [Paraburkholderia atlantica]
MSQHVFIVGGSSGIGFATASRLLDRRYAVTIAGRDSAKLAKAKVALRDAANTVRFDASDTSTIAGTFAEIGAIDHLVLALGSGKGGGPFSGVSLDAVRMGFDEKVFPHFACAQAALASIAKTGSITFLSAVSAHSAMPGTAGLGAANAAIAAIVPILAAELRPLRINAVSPGVIDTPWWDFLSAKDKESAFAGYAAITPVGRIGQPDDVAMAIEFLISNSFMSGQTIICDGGIGLESTGRAVPSTDPR